MKITLKDLTALPAMMAGRCGLPTYFGEDVYLKEIGDGPDKSLLIDGGTIYVIVEPSEKGGVKIMLEKGNDLYTVATCLTLDEAATVAAAVWQRRVK